MKEREGGRGRETERERKRREREKDCHKLYTLQGQPQVCSVLLGNAVV